MPTKHKKKIDRDLENTRNFLRGQVSSFPKGSVERRHYKTQLRVAEKVGTMEEYEQKVGSAVRQDVVKDNPELESLVNAIEVREKRAKELDAKVGFVDAYSTITKFFLLRLPPKETERYFDQYEKGRRKQGGLSLYPFHRDFFKIKNTQERKFSFDDVVEIVSDAIERNEKENREAFENLLRASTLTLRERNDLLEKYHSGRPPDRENLQHYNGRVNVNSCGNFLSGYS